MPSLCYWQALEEDPVLREAPVASHLFLALGAVENEEPEADARRFHTEMFLLMINRRKTCSRVVALVGLKFVVNKSR